MSGGAEDFSGEPHDLQRQGSSEEQEVPVTMEAPPPNTETGHEEGDYAADDTEVGHEVAPPRDPQKEGNVLYYAQLPTAEEDLSVNVGCDVRERSLSTPPSPRMGSAEQELGSTRYAEIPEDGGAGGGATSSVAVGGGESLTPQTTVAAARQPTQGTQVDADADIKGSHSRRTGAPRGARAADASSTNFSIESTEAPLGHGASEQQRAAPPSWSLAPQAAHGKVEVTATLLPMQTVIRLTVPVQSSTSYRPTEANLALARASEQDGSEGVGAAPRWVLLTKDLFEGVARFLLLHPEAIRIFHRHKRVRFMEVLLLGSDVTSDVGSPSRSAGAKGGLVDSAVNDRAEPIWISVTFPPLDNGIHAGASNGSSEAEEAQASLMAVPAHLFGLGSNDYIVRCIRVRPHKLEIPLEALVEGRKQGHSYDDVIQRLQLAQDTRPLLAAGEGGGGDGEDEWAAAPSSSFVIVTVLQGSPTTPEKPFLGGYRDRRHPDKLLLHASTQLYHKDLSYSPFAGTLALSGNRCTRQTQTIGISRSCQTHREACVQTPRIDLDLDTAHDFIVVARPYFTADKLHELQAEMSIIIQKMYRQWKARRIREELEVAEAARQHRAGARQRREEALQLAVEDAAQLRRDDPRSAEDFERLKQEVMHWRREEAARIQSNQSLSQIQRRAALIALTETELQLLQQLDQRCRDVSKSRQERRFLRTLNRMAAPKHWGTVHVNTPETERAAELRALYDRLCVTSSGFSVTASTAQGGGALGVSSSRVPTIPTSGNVGQTQAIATCSPSAITAASGSASAPTAAVDNAAAGLPSATAARLDILLRVKWTVREFDTGSPLTQELCELIDREADLLHRGRREASLITLRKRIQTLFVQFIEDPLYNPVAKEFAQTARDRARVKAAEVAKEKEILKARKAKSKAIV